MQIIDPSLCVKCKGRLWCGKPYCPILVKKQCLFQNLKFISKKEIEGNVYSLFIGRVGYPNVSVGLLSSERLDLLNDPRLWVKLDYDIKKIIDERVSLINAKTKQNVKEVGLENPLFEVVASKNPIFSYVELKKKPTTKLNLFPDYYPMGPTSPLKYYEFLDTPKVYAEVEKCYYDDYLKAEDAVWFLYNRGMDVYKISEVFSAGLLGIWSRRRLVPTRWAITAVDNIIGEKIKKELRDYKEINNYVVLEGNLLGNYLYFLLIPGPFMYEFFEVYSPKTSWNLTTNSVILKDIETITKKPPKEPNTAGAYYASRLAVLEFLRKIRRKATVIGIRVITEEYVVPLGIWVVREASRVATKNVKEFDTIEEAIRYLKSKIRNFDLIIKNSELLKLSRSNLLNLLKQKSK